MIWTDPDSRLTVTAGLPDLPTACSTAWLGRRLMIWPDGFPSRPLVSVISSRLHRQLDRETHWFAMLRAVVQRTDPEREALIVVPGTAASEAVIRAADLFGRTLFAFRLPEKPEDCVCEKAMQRWLEQELTPLLQPERSPSPDRSGFRDAGYPDRAVIVSPAFSPAVQQSEHPATQATVGHLADRLLFSLASRICVLKCRPRGNVSFLLRQHLSDPDRRDCLVWTAISHGESAARFCRHHLLDNLPFVRNVIPWIVDTGEGFSNAERSRRIGDWRDGLEESAETDGKTSRYAVWNHPLLTEPSDWLIHWTRACRGPWPQQTPREWLNELILGLPEASHSATATLLRILKRRELLASGLGIRGKFEVIAWTEVPLQEFRSRRQYRRHRQRYDFETRGIAVRRSTLAAMGARPVIYGAASVWEQLSDSDRPWFQKAEPHAGLDVAAEQEWRLLKSLDLSRLTHDELCVFVDNEQEQRLVQPLSPWPVVTVP
ncbi:MAG: hypothetical protein KDA96_06990 [Planctomycetaceae bacterium]|nr:hypothetical protein [Planctomycetaceae bacterium]